MAFVNTYLNTDEEMINGDPNARYNPGPVDPAAAQAAAEAVFTPEQRAAYMAPSEASQVPETFMGYTPPFTKTGDAGFLGLFGKDDEWRDANGNVVPENVVQSYGKTQEAKKTVDDLTARQASGQVVSPEDMKLALDQYRDAIGQARAQYTQILGHEPSPSPTEVLTKPTGSTVDTSKVQTVAPAERLQAALQAGTRVSATGLDTAQADQARAMGVQNMDDLRATAQGAGAGQQAAAARLKLALMRSSEMASGMAAQARGSERRGMRREAMLEGQRRGLEGALAGEQLAAQERMTAQGQLGQQIQATRATDVDVAAKRADLDQQRKTLQAQLDAAKASNDQNAINTVNAKMADLDQRTREFNAGEANKAQARSEDQAFEGQKVDIDRGIEVSRLTEEQRVANERLKLDASKAAQDAGAGLLNENARQEQLAFARQQMNNAKDQADRQFWGQIITSLLSGAASAGAAAVGKPAAHGGLVTRPTYHLVGEAGPEIIVPVDGKVSAKLAKALSVDAEPFDKGGDSALAEKLAAAVVKARKRAAN